MAAKKVTKTAESKESPKGSAALEKTMKSMDSPEDRADVDEVKEAVADRVSDVSPEPNPPAYQGHDRRP